MLDYQFTYDIKKMKFILVTPKWWNDLWLNEGFASWVEYLGFNDTHPEWEDVNFNFNFN